jgi:hypothetical protein
MTPPPYVSPVSSLRTNRWWSECCMVLIYDDGPVPPPRKIDELRKMPLITDPPSPCVSQYPCQEKSIKIGMLYGTNLWWRSSTPAKHDRNAVRYESMMFVQCSHQEQIDELHKMPSITHLFTFPDDPPPPYVSPVPPPRKINEDWNGVQYESMMTVQYPCQEKNDELHKLPLITDPPLSLCQSVPSPREIDDDWNAVQYHELLILVIPIFQRTNPTRIPSVLSGRHHVWFFPKNKYMLI